MHPKTLIKRHAFDNALHALQDAVRVAKEKEQTNDPEFEYLRDSVVQRFEFTIEARWKLLKSVIEYEAGLTITPSPKSVLKEAFKLSYISDLPIFFSMIEDRNRLSHEYGILIAKHIYPDIITYVPVIQQNRVHLQSIFPGVDKETSGKDTEKTST